MVTYIVFDGGYSKPIQSDLAVVFGNTVHKDGSVSLRLQARLEKTESLYKKGLTKKILVSGGLGKEGYYEAEKMAEYLEKAGVNSKDIIIDNKGNTTRDTAKNTAQQFDTDTSIIVVSQFYHITRAKLSFRKHGFTNVSSASADYFDFRDAYSLFREFFAVGKYMFR